VRRLTPTPLPRRRVLRHFVAWIYVEIIGCFAPFSFGEIPIIIGRGWGFDLRDLDVNGNKRISIFLNFTT
jgi:hypothetical protein